MYGKQITNFVDYENVMILKMNFAHRSDIPLSLYNIWSNTNKHNAEPQRIDPGTKILGEFGTKSHIFPPNAQNGFWMKLGKIH